MQGLRIKLPFPLMEQSQRYIAEDVRFPVGRIFLIPALCSLYCDRARAFCCSNQFLYEPFQQLCPCRCCCDLVLGFLRNQAGNGEIDGLPQEFSNA